MEPDDSWDARRCDDVPICQISIRGVVMEVLTGSVAWSLGYVAGIAVGYCLWGRD